MYYLLQADADKRSARDGAVTLAWSSVAADYVMAKSLLQRNEIVGIFIGFH